MYPVDLPAVDDTGLASASEQYFSSLESRPRNYDECFQSSQTSKVAITASNVRRLQLFEDDQADCTLLALHPPDDPMQVLALYLHEEWWCVDDILRTSSKSRSGLKTVQTITERVIVFLLSQVVERSSQEEVSFSLHPRTESCKLLWRDSQAVGFYTVKHKGSLCDSWSSHGYLLPVLDTVLVRKSSRRRGFGLQMLEDFCSSFSAETFLGVSSPLSASMVAVCRRFLQQHEEHRERLYEVEAPGGWTQRRNIWLNIRLGRYTLGINEESSPTSGETQRNEGDGSSQKMKTYNCRLDLTSSSTCNGNIPLATRSSEQQIKPCDPSQGVSSPTSEIYAGTGCSPAAHAEDPDPGPPTGPSRSHNTEQALISKPSVSAEARGGKPEAEETQRSAKRVRRT
ncbi:protein FAM169B isoform X1 [Dicentrarchus labrax]|uniref:Family with sequence similarity 169 member B n=1 Tax=Dicentrarchus labrax TaxID=13489 RepID=A0A8P4FZV9_DICLA|nr:protein FAM169B isoform X1 [Dicentrarchus labrax]XP_051239256.1 protein FAM169B isoform X1 [Dicentrarchus labrax]XP_051239257.1 protein FAM169B isoform X1 [Dicentrarchus labrax]XP_051239258.1 protein FAM169B isoform X1 [Dicentrarchus labrax]